MIQTCNWIHMSCKRVNDNLTISRKSLWNMTSGSGVVFPTAPIYYLAIRAADHGLEWPAIWSDSHILQRALTGHGINEHIRPHGPCTSLWEKRKHTHRCVPGLPVKHSLHCVLKPLRGSHPETRLSNSGFLTLGIHFPGETYFNYVFY